MKPLGFMVVGAQKCGTTALAEFLGEHPDIEMAQPKEPHLFDDPVMISQEGGRALWLDRIAMRYSGYFSDAGYMLRGEATPVYLYQQGTAELLLKYNPDLKLIAILRDPVRRAYSHYQMEYGRGNETLPYWKALLMERQRLRDDKDPYAPESAHRRHSYRDRGLYCKQLEALMVQFPASQILVLSNEQLKHQHSATLDRVFRFLGVEPLTIEPRLVFSAETDISEVPFSSWFLRLSYRRELRQLREIIDFDISGWF